MIKVFLLFILFIFLSVSVVGAPSCEPGSGAIFVQDFENGMQLETLLAKSGNTPEVTDEIARVGDYSMKTYLNREISSNSYRTEAVPKDTSQYQNNNKHREDYWYGISVYLPDEFIPTERWEMVMQWHGVPDQDIGEDWRNAMNALYTTDGLWTYKQIWDSKRNTFENGRKNYDGQEFTDFGPYETGKWTDWVYHIRWSYEDDGLTQIWKDGELVMDRTGPNAYNDAVGPYFKFGLYKGWRNSDPPDVISERLLFHDELRIAKGSDATYGDVAPECFASEDENNQNTYVSCNTISTSSELPEGFGSPFDLETNNLIMDSKCLNSQVKINVGERDSNIIVYKYGYVWKNNNWEQIQLDGTLLPGSDVWLEDVSSATIAGVETSNPTYLLNYFCKWTNSEWKCGCRDQSCNQNYWNLQIAQSSGQ